MKNYPLSMSSCLINSKYPKIISDTYNSLKRGTSGLEAQFSKAIPAFIAQLELLGSVFPDTQNKILAGRTDANNMKLVAFCVVLSR